MPEVSTRQASLTTGKALVAAVRIMRKERTALSKINLARPFIQLTLDRATRTQGVLDLSRQNLMHTLAGGGQIMTPPGGRVYGPKSREYTEYIGGR